MNPSRFESLEPELQDALVTAAREAASYQRELNREQAADDLAAIEAAGVEVVEDIDTTPFRDKVFDEVREEYESEFGSELVEAIVDLR